MSNTYQYNSKFKASGGKGSGLRSTGGAGNLGREPGLAQCVKCSGDLSGVDSQCESLIPLVTLDTPNPPEVDHEKEKEKEEKEQRQPQVMDKEKYHIDERRVYERESITLL